MKKLILARIGVVLGLFLFVGYALAIENSNKLTVTSNVQEHIYITIPTTQDLTLVTSNDTGEAPLANTTPLTGTVATNESGANAEFTMYVNNLTLKDNADASKTMKIRLYICSKEESTYVGCGDNGGEVTIKNSNRIKLSQIINGGGDHRKSEFKFFAKSEENSIQYFAGTYENLQMQLTYIID